MSETLSSPFDERFKILETEIHVNDESGGSYVFAIPSLSHYTKVSMRAAAIRREMDPAAAGMLYGLDQGAIGDSWGYAAFEVLLRKASVEWPYSKDEKGGPKVDYREFPGNKAREFTAVYTALDAALNRFREGGSTARQPTAQ